MVSPNAYFTERERERERETDRQTERDRERQRETERDRERQRERQRETERDTFLRRRDNFIFLFQKILKYSQIEPRKLIIAQK